MEHYLHVLRWWLAVQLGEFTPVRCAVLAAAVLLAAVPLLCRFRAGRCTGIQAAAGTALLPYLLFVWQLSVFSRPDRHIRVLHWIPFWSYAEALGGPYWRWMAIFSNILMTIPLGFLLPAHAERIRCRTVVWIGLLFSLSIEILQYCLACGETDIDDLINNALGVVIGFMVYRVIDRMMKKRNDRALGEK